MASYRYRTQVPAEYCNAHINESGGEPAEIVVFSKPYPEDVELARQAKENGAKVVVDLCDPHLHLEHYQEILKHADAKVVASEWSRDHMVPGAVYIPDPYEFEVREPHADGDQYIWFGHRTNIKDVEYWARMPNLTIVSGPYNEEPKGVIPYTPETLRKELISANIALLPTRVGAEYKSNNRLVNAIRMGIFAVCQRHPSYEEFKDFIWVGDVRTGMRWAKHHQSELNDLVAEAQGYIEKKYSPEAVGERWKDFLSSI